MISYKLKLYKSKRLNDGMEFLTIVDIKISQEMIKFKTNLSDVKN